MKIGAGVCVGILLAVAVCLRAEDQGAERPWAGVATRLGDADFAVRETAQKTLDGATWKDLAELRKLRDGARDAEAKVRLAKRVEMLEEEAAVIRRRFRSR